MMVVQGMTFTPSNTGGEYNHKLTVNEMPSHTHEIQIPTSTNWTGNGGNAFQLNNQTTLRDTYSYIKANGGDQSHNNIQPYIVVYFWRRTA